VNTDLVYPSYKMENIKDKNPKNSVKFFFL
jgi:hypothetical protein